MQSYRRREFLSSVGIAGATATFGTGATATEPVEVEAVYVWGRSGSLIRDPDAVVERVKKVGISKLYLAWGPLRSVDESQIETFVRRCKESKIDVYALLGLTGWNADTAARTELGRIAAYNAGNVPFDGVQLDVEPGGDVSFDYESWLSELYVGLLDSLKELDLPAVEVALAPWWFDRAEAAAMQVRDHGNVDGVVVMSYADTYTSAAGASVKRKLNRSLKGSEQPYHAALEFQDPARVEGLADGTTLYGKRERAAEIIRRLDEEPPANGAGAYGGVAFHYYPYLDVLY